MSKNGFTLLEVLIAIALITTSVASLGLALRTGRESSRRAVWKMEGGALLSQALAQIEDPLTGATGELAGGASWEYKAEPYLLEEELYLAKLTVSWEEGGRRQNESYTLLTGPEGFHAP